MPCKSLRFVVSPLTAPLVHDRRRCSGCRNTIISAVNKFLPWRVSLARSLFLSRETGSGCPADSPAIASWPRSRSSPRISGAEAEDPTLSLSLSLFERVAQSLSPVFTLRSAFGSASRCGEPETVKRSRAEADDEGEGGDPEEIERTRSSAGRKSEKRAIILFMIDENGEDRSIGARAHAHQKQFSVSR